MLPPKYFISPTKFSQIKHNASYYIRWYVLFHQTRFRVNKFCNGTHLKRYPRKTGFSHGKRLLFIRASKCMFKVIYQSTALMCWKFCWICWELTIENVTTVNKVIFVSCYFVSCVFVSCYSESFCEILKKNTCNRHHIY